MVQHAMRRVACRGRAALTILGMQELTVNTSASDEPTWQWSIDGPRPRMISGREQFCVN
jgi:hypothetical protein